MRKVRAGLLALVLAFLLAAPAAAQDAAPPDLQSLYDRATTAAEASRHDEAAALFYQGLEALRAEGRGETADAGMFASGLAEALAAGKDPQTDEAYRLAIALLARAADPVPFLKAAYRFAERLSRAGAHDEAASIADAMLRRTEAEGTDDAARIYAIETALGVYGAADRDADADRALATAMTLKGNEPRACYLRGLARGRLAREARGAGRVAESIAALDAAIVDLRCADESDRPILGTLLLLRAQVAFGDGEYRVALPLLEEAIPVLAADPTEETAWSTALALRGRLLERLDRVKDALRSADEEIAAFEKRFGGDAQNTIAARLDRLEFLVRDGRSEEARRALADEEKRLGGEADVLIAGYFYERLAAIERADGNYAAAADAAEQSLAIRREHFPDVPALQLEAMRIRADVTGGIADLDYAERSHRELIALSEEIFPSNHPELARDLNAFASFLGSLRRFDEAEAIERRCAAILKIAYGEDGAKYGFALSNLAGFIVFNGKAEEAIALYRQSVAIIDRLPDQEDFRALARLNLASALSVARQYEEALAVADESIAMHKLLPPRAQRRLGALYGIRMQALAGLDRAKEAVAAGREMVAMALGDTYEDANNLVAGLTAYSLILRADGAAAEALGAARRAMDTLHQQQAGAGWVYRDSARALVGAAYAAAH